MNWRSFPGVTEMWLASLAEVDISTLPRYRPGEPGTAGRLKTLAVGVRTENRRVETFTASVSVTTWTGTLASVAVQTPPVPQGALVVQAPPRGTVLPAPMERHFAS